MINYQYIRIPLKYLTQEIRNEYNTLDIVDNDYVYIEIGKGMYGLKEAGTLAFNYVVENLKPHGYHLMELTSGLWKHEIWKTTFELCVDDFVVKYHNQNDLEHLLNALNTKYEISTDRTGSIYIELAIDWDYAKGHFDISMQDYINKTLQKFLHKPPTRKTTYTT